MMSTEVNPTERLAIHKATHQKYRPDIDALRALAILPVVLNHVEAKQTPGGFVGVDIFFRNFWIPDYGNIGA